MLSRLAHTLSHRSRATTLHYHPFTHHTSKNHITANARVPHPNLRPFTNDSTTQGSTGNESQRPVLESALSTLATLLLVASVGIAYHYAYKAETLRKMARAFAEGYDPVLELAKASNSPWQHGIERVEQALVDDIVRGNESGDFFLR